MKADAWVNSSALLGRMNFALSLTAGKLKGVQVDSDRIVGSSSLGISSLGTSSLGTSRSAGVPPATPDPQATLAALESSLLAGDVSRQTHDTIVAQIDNSKSSQGGIKPGPSQNRAGPPGPNTIAGLIAGIARISKKVSWSLVSSRWSIVVGR